MPVSGIGGCVSCLAYIVGGMTKRFSAVLRFLKKYQEVARTNEPRLGFFLSLLFHILATYLNI